MVGEGRGLRHAGGAARELDVDGVVELELGLEGVDAPVVLGADQPREVVEGEHPGRGLGAEAHDPAQGWQPGGAKRHRGCLGELG